MSQRFILARTIQSLSEIKKRFVYLFENKLKRTKKSIFPTKKTGKKNFILRVGIGKQFL